MNPSDTICEVEKFHAIYLKHSQADPGAREYQLQWFERCYFEAIKIGITADDWDLVLGFMVNQNKRQPDRSFHRKLKPSRILNVHDHRDLMRLMEDLAEAKRIRARKPTPQQQVVAEFRRHQEPPNMKNMSRHIKDVMLNGLNADISDGGGQ